MLWGGAARQWVTPQARSAPDCDAERLRNTPALETQALTAWSSPKASDDKAPTSHTKGGRSIVVDAKQWQTPKAGEEDSGSGMNSRGEEKLKAQALNWSTPQAHDPKGNLGAGTTSGGGRKRDLNREAGQWMTPVANDDNKTPEAHLAMKARMKGGPRSTITSLNVQSQAWPTPTATSGDQNAETPTPGQTGGTTLGGAVKVWPTPAARDEKGENSEQHATVTGGGRKHMDQLANFVAHSPQVQQISDGEPSSETNLGSRQRLVDALTLILSIGCKETLAVGRDQKKER